jgi:hypothetical protein
MGALSELTSEYPWVPFVLLFFAMFLLATALWVEICRGDSTTTEEMCRRLQYYGWVIYIVLFLVGFSFLLESDQC